MLPVAVQVLGNQMVSHPDDDGAWLCLGAVVGAELLVVASALYVDCLRTKWANEVEQQDIEANNNAGKKKDFTNWVSWTADAKQIVGRWRCSDLICDVAFGVLYFVTGPVPTICYVNCGPRRTMSNSAIYCHIMSCHRTNRASRGNRANNRANRANRRSQLRVEGRG